jgi:hypothetical protein
LTLPPAPESDSVFAVENKTADRIAAEMRETGNLNPVAPTSPWNRPTPNDTGAALAKVFDRHPDRRRS